MLGGHPSGSAKLSLLKEAWEECAGEWKKSSPYKKITNNNMDIANAICKAKEDDPELSQTQIKDHPDAPGVEAGHGFLVFSVVC